MITLLTTRGVLGRSAGAAPPFVPTDISDLGLWLDASDSSTLFNATSGGSLPAEGASVARIEDKSGNGRHYTQGSSSFRPLRSSSGLSFDGSNDVMSQTTGLDLLQNVSGATCFVVAYTTSASGTVRGAWVATNPSNQGRFGVFSGFAANRFSFAGRRLDADSFTRLDGTTNFTTSVTYTITALVDYSAASAYLYRNGTLDASSTSFLTAGSTSNTASSLIVLGQNGVQAGQIWSGLIYEVLVYRRALNTSERGQVEDYLRDKWGHY